ncbi:MAG: hypothetical protein J0L99_19050 [Chitinophagales bacterium]|nr:hypothetical protein [Chitinophagales bacterium]
MKKIIPAPVLLVWALVALFIALVQNNFFFWDTVQLASKHAHHFYNNGLAFTLLPGDIDSGHPPTLGYLLALCWTFFGKTLPVGHWLMFPFIALMFLHLYRIGLALSDKQHAWLLFLPVLADPVLLGQMSLVSPDVLLLCGFLMALDGRLNQRLALQILGYILLAAISMRGMMTAAALALAPLGLAPLPYYKNLINSVLQKNHRTVLPLLAVVPGAVLAFGYLYWHQRQSGWTGFHPDSPWAPAFAWGGWSGMLKNCAVLGWRLLDFNRLFEFLLVAILIRKFWLSKIKLYYSNIFFLLIFLAILLFPSALWYKNLSAHRYFLPFMVGLHCYTFQLLMQTDWSVQRKKWVSVVLSVLLLLGNLQIYPRGISMDWDATLAHLPYYALRTQAVRDLDAMGIDFGSTGSAFPNLSVNEMIVLNGDMRQFAPFDFEKNKWVMVSNVYNDVQESDYKVLAQQWQERRRYERCGVWIILYERPAAPPIQ